MGSNSVAMGSIAYATGTSSMALGSAPEATGTYAVSIGRACGASGTGDGAFAIGFFNSATGDRVGSNTTASGVLSTSLGHSSRAIGNYSTALGEDTYAPYYAHTDSHGHSQCYAPVNANGTTFVNTDLLFILGNGTALNFENNVLVILKNGQTAINTTDTGGYVAPRAAFDVNSTSAMIVPVGNTVQRPNTPVPGMIRFNTTLGKFEGYDGAAWVTLH